MFKDYYNSMHDIEVEIINRFNKNISYLSSHEQELYNRINLLTEFIETQEYTPRYHLEYFEQANIFDIYDSTNDTYLYKQDSKLFDNQALQKTNFDKINSFDLLQYDFYNPTCKYFYSEATSIYEKADAEVINNIFEFTKIFKSSTQEKNKKFKSIDKFVFVGTLLGTHIDKIDNKISSSSYFICEHNLEIFRLSLFVTDYSELAQTSKLYFSIMDDRDIFVNKFNNYLSNSINANYMVKYYCTNYNIHDYFDRILDSISQYSPTKFTYELMLNHLLKKFIQNINRYKILNTKNKLNILNNQLTLLLGAGPSLEKNIKWLKKNQDKYFIISIGAAVNKLVSHNILPDLIITVDAAQYVAKQFDEKHLDKIDSIPILASHMTHDKVLNRLEKNNIILFEVITTIKENSTSFIGASVSEIAFQIATLFCAKEIYMLGIDLALNQKTGSSHIEEYENKKVYKVDENSKKLNSFLDEKAFCNKDSTMVVKGNFEDEVITTTTFNKSLYYFNYIIKLELENNNNLKVYNLSDGAYINNTIPMSIASIDNINNNNLSTKDIDIFKELNDHTTEWFNKRELKTIKESLKLINSIQTELNFLKTKMTLTYDDFLDIRERLFNLTLHRSKKYENLLLYSIFNNYISITEPYIYYHLNGTNTNGEKNLNNIVNVWIEQINDICDDYKSIIENEINRSKIYGAVHKKNYFSFVGFCKELNNNEIKNVDVYIDGEKVDTVKADCHNIKEVNKVYAINNQSFKYNLKIEFLTTSHNIDFKYKNIKLNHFPIDTIGPEDNNFFKYKFLYSISEPEIINKQNYFNKNAPKSIGFLLSNENIKDSDFISYINKLSVKFPFISFSLFHFKNNEKEKSNYLSNLQIDSRRLKLVTLETLESITNNISIFIVNSNIKESNTSSKISKLLSSYCPSIFVSRFKSKKSNLLALEHRLSKDSLWFRNPEILNLTTEDISKANYNLPTVICAKLLPMITNKKYSLTKEKTLDDFKLFDLISFMIESPKLIQLFYKVRNFRIQSK